MKVLSSTSGFPAWASSKGRRTPRASGFEGQWGLIAGIPQDWGKQKLHSWREHTRSSVHQDPGKKAVTSSETGPDLPASPGGSPAEAGVAVAHCRDKDTGSGSSGEYSWHEPSWSPPFPHKT